MVDLSLLTALFLFGELLANIANPQLREIRELKKGLGYPTGIFTEWTLFPSKNCDWKNTEWKKR